MARYFVELSKEDFKFSSAHFTLFGEGMDEPLHGHNYRVSVRIEAPEIDERGLLVDFGTVKARVRELCARLDDRVLLPERASSLVVQLDGARLRLRCGERSYEFPAEEVLLLPLANTSVELFSRWIWEQLAPTLAGTGADRLAVIVEETSGQRGGYEAPLTP